MTENLKILWADQDHLFYWQPWIDALSETGLFQIRTLPSVATKHVLALCPHKDIVVIHSGTNKKISNLVDLVQRINKEYPDTAIALLTDAEQELANPFIHGYLSTMVEDTDEIVRDLQNIYRRIKNVEA